MALYHFHVEPVKRTDGRTAVASAAYRAGEKLLNLWDGETHDYRKKGGVIYTEIILPDHAPRRFYDRSTLWNELEQVEKRADAQLCYSFDLSLQNELSMEENIAMAKEFVEKYFVADGMIADFAVHAPDKEPGGIPNPHFHVLTPIRPLNADGTWGAKQRREYRLDENGQRIKKENGQWDFNAVPTTDWGKPETLDMWRKAWADLVNAKFEEKGLDCRIDHRSYVDMGLDLLPTIHEGPHVRKMEKRGIRTEIGELNRWIKVTNKMLGNIRATIAALKEWLQEAKQILSESKEVYLVELLRSCLDERNETSKTYRRGRNKAHNANRKRFMEECEFLKAKGVYTLSDFESYLSSVDEKVESCKGSMSEKRERMKALQQLIETAKTYQAMKPVFDEMQKPKYKFAKAKEAYKSEHESELKRFYMAKRKLKEAGFEKEPFPLNAWNRELEQLSAQNDAVYQEYKGMQSDLMMLRQIKGDVDRIMRQRNPEAEKQEQTKETTL